jgi:hypothetical protein
MLSLLVRPFRFAVLMLSAVAAMGVLLPRHIQARPDVRPLPRAVNFVALQEPRCRMETMDFEQYKARALAAGFDEVLERVWAPAQVLDEHRHPFAVQARVVQGEFWLICEGQSRHIPAGHEFELARDVPHAERYGADGATVWVARRHGD